MDLLHRPGLRAALVLLTCSALAVLTYGHTLAFPFLAWDDTNYILQDPVVQQPSLANLVACWTTPRVGVWYPLARSSHLVDVWLFGNNPFAHRMENLLLHIINSALVFLLCWQWLPRAAAGMTNSIRYGFALAAAALFAVHPQHVEVVVWLTQRNELLATLFFLICLLAYFHYTEQPAARRRWFLASIACSALAMAAKPTAVATPVVLVLLDRLYRKDITLLQSIREKWLFFTITVAICTASLLTHHDANALYAHDLYNLPQRMQYSLDNSVMFYWKFLYPVDLVPFRAMDSQVIDFNWTWFIFRAGILTVILVTGFTRDPMKHYPWISLLLLLLVLPASGIVMFGSYGSGNRYMYMPSAILLPLLAIPVAQWWQQGKRGLHATILAGTVIVASWFSWLTISLAKNWHDDITLWQYVTKVQPDAAYPKFYLAFRQWEHKQITTNEMAARVEEAVAIEPLLPALNALVVAYTELGDTGRLVQTHQRIVATYPHHSAFSKASLAIYEMLHVIPGDGQALLLQAMQEDPTLCTRIDRARQQLENHGQVPDPAAFAAMIEQVKSAAACKSAP